MHNDRPSIDQVRALVGDHVVEQYNRDRSERNDTNELQRLHKLLVSAAQIYEAGPKQQRQAVCDAVIAVTDFLKVHGFSSATLVPLSRVVWSIVDVCEQNQPDPLFCEKPKKTKPRRSMKDAVRQGHLAALADAWLQSRGSDESDEAAELARAARYMSGTYFGTLNGIGLLSARSYQRQLGQHELVYSSFKQMKAVLATEATCAGGGAAGMRLAIEVQISAMNAKAELLKP